MKQLLIFICALLLCFSGLAQDQGKYSNVAGYGFRYKRQAQDSVFMIPLSTSPHQPYRAGGLRYDTAAKKLQIYSGSTWLDAKPFQINDSSFTFMGDTVIIRGTGGAVYSFENGLTESGSHTIKLGGHISEETRLKFSVIAPTDTGYVAFNTLGKKGLNILGDNQGTEIVGLHFTDPNTPSTTAKIFSSYGILNFSSYNGSNGAELYTGPDALKITVSRGSLSRGIDFTKILPDTGIIVFDEIGNTGMYYGGDYSANGIARHGNRWLPDWGAIGDTFARKSNVVANNFVTSNLTLSAPLREHTFGDNEMRFKFNVAAPNTEGYIGFNNATKKGLHIYGDNNGSDIVGIHFTDPTTPTSIMSITGFNGTMQHSAQLGSNSTGINVGPSTLSLGTFQGANGRGINFTKAPTQDTGINVFDATKSIGMYYDNDYSTNGIANHGNRWIPDWGAVLGAVAGGGTIPQYRIPFGGPGNTQTTSTYLQYIDSQKAVRAAKFLATNYARSGDSIYANTNATKYNVFFGDSWTQGTLYPVHLRWSTKTSSAMNSLEINYAIGGTGMVFNTPGDSSAEERIFRIPVYNSGTHNSLFVCYGINDCGNAAVDTNEYRASYSRWLDSAIIARGWPAQNIVVVGQMKVFSNNVLANQRDTTFLRIAGEVAAAKGTKFVNPYKSMVANGGTNLLQSDKVHGNEYGHEIVANVILDSLRLRIGNMRSTGHLSSTGLTTIQPAGNNLPMQTFLDSARKPIAEIRGYYGAGSYDASLGIGSNSLSANNTGINNYAFGQEGLATNTTGNSNIAIGLRALQSNVSGSSNVGIGTDALRFNTASNNTGVGFSALNFNTTGTLNAAFGEAALLNNTTGSNNSAFGPEALFANVSASNNTGIGTKVMRNTTGGNNTAIGNSALITQTSGGNNTAIGNGAMLNNLTGSFCVGLGSNALTAILGNNNTGTGYQVADSVTTGTNNAFYGTRSAHNLGGAASGNAFFGAFSGLNIRSGNNNHVFSSQLILPANSNFSKRMYLTQDNDTATIYSDSLLNVIIGASLTDVVAKAKLDVKGTLAISTLASATLGDSLVTVHDGVLGSMVYSTGSYTPTVGDQTNIDAIGTVTARYQRTGNMVTVSGRVNIDPTASGTTTQFSITLPFATSGGSVNGTVCNSNGAGGTVEEGSNKAFISILSNHTNNLGHSFIFQYVIQ